MIQYAETVIVISTDGVYWMPAFAGMTTFVVAPAFVIRDS